MIATLTAKTVKVTLVVDPADVIAIPMPLNAPAPTVLINAAGRSLSTKFSAKSLRRAQLAIKDVGLDSVVVVVQGKMGVGNEVVEAGIVATARTQKHTIEAA